VQAQFLPTSFVSARILSVARQCDNILQAAPDHINQKHSSSIEDNWVDGDDGDASKRAEPWWKEPTKGSWYAYMAAWLGWAPRARHRCSLNLEDLSGRSQKPSELFRSGEALHTSRDPVQNAAHTGIA
jgi:hypothetical protein